MMGGFNLKGAVTGVHCNKQMRPPLLLGFGLATCLALYALFSDPVGAGARWSVLSRGGDGSRKTGTLAATASDSTGSSIAPPQSPSLEAPDMTNESRKRDEIEELSPPLSPIFPTSNLPSDEPKQAAPSPPPTTATTNIDDPQIVSVSASLPPPPPLPTIIPLNASLPPAPIAADKPIPASASPDPITPQNSVAAAGEPIPASASPDPITPQNSVAAAGEPVPASASSESTITQNPVGAAEKSVLPPTASYDEELLRVLQRASLGNNTVIITTLNEAWAVPNSIIDLFFESFRIGIGTQELLQHLVIVAVDPRAFERCKVIHPHCYLMVTEGMDFSKEELYMTPDYMAMMWRRLQFMGSILELGFSFVFTDTDVMWFRNPFLHFDRSTDLSIACDHYVGDPYNLYNGVNGGFYYVQSNPRTIEFYKYWYRSRWQHPENNEQDVFNMIKGDDFTNKLGIKIRFLDTIYFSGFCEPSKYFGKVITMHATCCVGIDNKMNDLKLVLEDWGNYTKLSQEDRRYTLSEWRIPRSC